MAVALVALAAAVPARALDPAKQLSQFGHHSWTQQQGLPQDSVRAIVQAPDGALWIGTDEGLARFDGTDFTVFRQSRDGLPSSSITALMAARDGAIWVGTLGGVSRLENGRFTHFSPADGPGHADASATCSNHATAPSGWLAVESSPRSAHGRSPTTDPSEGVPAEGLRKIVETADGVLVAAGFAEIVRFDGRAVPSLQPELIDGFGAASTSIAMA